jgi:hypothetical protein
MQQTTSLSTIIGEVNGVATTGVFLLQQSVAFTGAASLFKLRLNSSIDNTATKRCLVAVITGDVPRLAASDGMPGVLIQQTARYGGASVLISEWERKIEQGILVRPGDKISVYVLADDLGCLVAYTLNLHHRDL